MYDKIAPPPNEIGLTIVYALLFSVFRGEGQKWTNGYYFVYFFKQEVVIPTLNDCLPFEHTIIKNLVEFSPSPPLPYPDALLRFPSSLLLELN